MSKNSIFNNYVVKCPKCGGELSPEDFLCPYCGEDLRKHNEEYKDNEQQITDAWNRIDNASRQLKRLENYAEQNSFKKSKEKRRLIILFAVIGIFVGFLALGGIFAIQEISLDKKIENLENELHTQIVETVTVDINESAKTEIYKDTQYTSAMGNVQENDKTYKVPFYSESYNNGAKYKGYLYLDKFELDDIKFYDTDSVSLYGKDMSVRIQVENGSYYEKCVDAVIITDYTMDKVERLDDIKFGDYTFECYLCSDDYILVSNPYPELFIVYEFSSYDYDRDIKDFDLSEYFLIQDIELEMK